MDDERSIQDQYYQTAREVTSIEYGNIYYDGIRSALKKISEDFNIDLGELEKSFSEGSRESEAFSAEAEFLRNAITNQKNKP